jgi:ATP-binding cassette subfamily F protein 2
MAPSASKQKRLAEKAAKKVATSKNEATPSSTTGSADGGSTPLTTLSGAGSKAASQEDLMSMARLNIATDRSP